MNIIEPGVNTKELFSIHISDEGTYLAIRNESSPLFCFEGDTVEEVTAQAVKAFEFYKKRFTN